MRFILTEFDKRVTTYKAIISKILSEDAVNNYLSDDLRTQGYDFIEMYKTYKKKLVTDATASVYNGDINNDILSGPGGTKVKGLPALQIYARKLSDAMTNYGIK